MEPVAHQFRSHQSPNDLYGTTLSPEIFVGWIALPISNRVEPIYSTEFIFKIECLVTDNDN